MRAEILAGLYRRLLKAQITTKAATDAHRRDVEFAIGDWVYVRVRPFRQTSLVLAYTKLTKRYYGPFQVIERIGAIAYRF